MRSLMRLKLRVLAAIGLGVATLVLMWVHPVLVFPVWMILRQLELAGWDPFDMDWQSWKECLIPTAIYVPVHIVLFR